MARPGRWWLPAALAVVAAAAGYYAWARLGQATLPAGVAGGNGRIEAVEIDIATRIPGRLREILVNEGDFVTAGQVVARIDTRQLEAQRRQAQAQIERATIGTRPPAASSPARGRAGRRHRRRRPARGPARRGGTQAGPHRAAGPLEHGVAAGRRRRSRRGAGCARRRRRRRAQVAASE
jgi:HlyD family secretion protein